MGALRPEVNFKRRIIETVIGQLAVRVHLGKVRTRDIWSLTVRMGRKLLAHTGGCYLNHELGNPVLKLEMTRP